LGYFSRKSFEIPVPASFAKGLVIIHDNDVPRLNTEQVYELRNYCFLVRLAGLLDKAKHPIRSRLREFKKYNFG
jgi:hypothetical protein